MQRALRPLGTVTPATRSGRLPGGAECLQADLADAQSLAAALEGCRPTLVVNAAAYTAVDRAETEPELAGRINGDAVGEIARWCAGHAARLLHYSTDYVFDGTGARPYREDDGTAPLGVYGRSKREGELQVQASDCDHLIVRTAWVYAARGSNFLRTMLRAARERESLRVVDDQFGAPTPARWIAAASAAVLARDANESRIVHLSAAGETTWCGFARAIFAAAVRAGVLERAPVVEPIATAQYPTPARRPGYSRLDTQRLRAHYGIELPDWRVGLDEVIGELS
ncbi:MAG TPA: dTDP-4-dehydrorhamnose reductase [Xanthomonadaceae bacterium]|nr:dTDP-4-dehydrorhamnose reductase [Xanthomonadaceae bacterium]